MRRPTQKMLAAITTPPKMGRWRRRDPIPLALPAFDGPQVTEEDIRRWLLAVPRLDPASPRAARYVISYRVADKIARAKALGQFERIIDGRQAAECATWAEK